MAATKLNYNTQLKNRIEDSASTGNMTVVNDGQMVVAPGLQYDVNLDTLQLGNPGTNYVEISNSGFITKEGDAQTWEDIWLDVAIKAPDANSPDFDMWYDNTTKGVKLYTFTKEALEADEKELYFNVKLPRDWNYNGVFIDIHWVGNTSETGTRIRWGLEYTCKDVGGTFTTTDTAYDNGYIYPEDADIVEDKHYVTPISLSMAGISEINAMLVCRLFRNSSDVDDTYLGDAGLLGVSLKYQANSLGSQAEHSKT